MMNVVIEKWTQDDAWYVDFGASNHMTSHDEWFGEMQDLQNPGYVQTCDDSCHLITHIGKVPLALHDGKTEFVRCVACAINYKELSFCWSDGRARAASEI